MIQFFEKFKIPTILGLTVIFLGITSGVFLVLKDQPLLSKASPNILPDEITFTNIEDSTVTVSWQTTEPTPSFITLGTTDRQQTAKDERDLTAPAAHYTHYIALKNLLPQTAYQLKVVAGRAGSKVFEFNTASPVSAQNNFGPIIGSVLDGDKPLDEGIVYLSIAGAIIQSAPVKDFGSFLIPLTQIRKADLSDIFPLREDLIAKLTIVAKGGQTVAIFKLKAEGVNLASIKLGQNLDLTTQKVEEPNTSEDSTDFDLNDDGQINAADNALILKNFGRNPKDKRADLNGDGVVDQKDLDLMQKQINQ